MKNTYEVHFIGTVSGSSSSNGPVFTSTRKAEAIKHAKHAAKKHAGHKDFQHGFYEVHQTWPACCIFQGKAVK